ncbi:MAG: TIGR02452 family protein [Armatimonadetes bacterium]|nr:TIGR02452 family protein [Armatimonadota bacterium]
MNNIKSKSLALAATEALEVQERGWYRLPGGKTVSIEKALRAACTGSKLYLPEDFENLWEPLEPTGGQTIITVENLSTLEAAQALRQRFRRVALLNFASAKNPGGGFLSGARAQEESLARSSGLYFAIRSQPEFYAFHREQRSCLYTDRVIFSPDVPVFADDDHRPVLEPWIVSMLTCAAVNVGALAKNSPQSLGWVREVMARRVRMVLAVAAAHQIEALVLGAWGCGVFRCDPEMIAQLFADALAEPKLAGRFTQITFAIMNPRSGPDKNIAAFERQFSAAGAGG